MAGREEISVNPRELSEKGFEALGYPVGVRFTGPIVDAPGTTVFIAHPSGRSADGRPMSGPPFAVVRLRSGTGEIVTRAPLAPGDEVFGLFPPRLTLLDEHVIASESPEALRRHHEVVRQLQSRVLDLHARQQAVLEDDRSAVEAFALALRRVLWQYELPAYEAIGREFFHWLDEAPNASTP